MNSNINIRKITFLSLGIALFVVLSMCVRAPILDNYYLCLGYIVVAVYAWCFDWYSGAVIGFFGTILYCVVGSLGFNGMPGWALGNIFIGIILGITFKYIRKVQNKLPQFVLFVAISTVSTFVGISIIKSLVDMFIVQQPFVLRFAKNMTSFIADTISIVIGYPVCLGTEKYLENR